MSDTNVIQLVQAEGEARVDSRLIAGHLGVKHKNTMSLIDRYADRFGRFGVLPFQTEKPPKGTAGGRPERFALLNEDRAYFLLSLSRNTERVVELKANLVLALTSCDLQDFEARCMQRFGVPGQLRLVYPAAA